LYDLESGWWFQPAVSWKPNSKFTVEAFANIFTASSNNENVIQTVDWADEIVFRLAWQF
jgi:quinolinate synthase